MREIRQSGSGGGATFNPSRLPHPVRVSSARTRCAFVRGLTFFEVGSARLGISFARHLMQTFCNSASKPA